MTPEALGLLTNVKLPLCLSTRTKLWWIIIKELKSKQNYLFFAPILGWGLAIGCWWYESVLPADPGRWTRQGFGFAWELHKVKKKKEDEDPNSLSMQKNPHPFLKTLLLWSPESR
jgi:hypothetical protein